MLMNAANAELIVLASPPEYDDYYRKVEKDIIEFQINYAQKIIANGDQVLILSSDRLYQVYIDTLGKNHVLNYPMQDIWMRDFTLTNPIQPVMFRYSAAGQGGGKLGQKLADSVQAGFYRLVESIGVAFKKTDLINDGGNFVDDYAGNVVLSDKFLRDNKLSAQEAKDKLRVLTDAKNIAFIEADEQGGLEHADGIVSFIDENTLVINSYPQDQAYAEQLKQALKQSLPNVKLYEIITAYNYSNIYDKHFGSACGLYTNMLVTKQHIYFPQFGIPEDKIALKQILAITTKKVIPVDSYEICKMGGSVRCMSLQLRGDSAEKLITFAQNDKQKKDKLQ
ncbi:agmatine deiminase family protein [Fastidiosibacter lacustris]|uniref:agmatine deiminase family protein n=1 Tax=Fastidiosibacter lacustris TaxID=2056695 RepID=UPI000E34BAB9|nr:agmatine deiminase family protein [Fastidiosibacter lacustris]